MSVDYDSVAGYGVEISEYEFKLVFKKELSAVFKDSEIEESDMSDLWEEIGLDAIKRGYGLEYSGSSYSGNLDYYLIIDDNNITTIIEKTKKLIADLKSVGIDKEIKFISEVLQW